MSRALHLDTSDLGDNRRYSFLKTPLEMQSPEQQSLHAPQPATTVSEVQTLSQQPTAAEHLSQHPSQHPSWLEEKSQSYQPSQYASGYPNIDQHPAIYAPYADAAPLTQPSNAAAPQYSYADPDPPKKSPERTVSQQTPHDLPIAPDANPLQSPKPPYFPPPTAAGAPMTTPVREMGTYHQPGQIQHPNQQIKGGAWSHGLCDCSNIWTCCLGLTCPCILYGKTQYRLSMLSRREDPTNMLGYETCNGSCTAMAVLCGCQCKLMRKIKLVDLIGS